MKLFNFLFLSCIATLIIYGIFGLCIDADISKWHRTETILFIVLTIVIDSIIAAHLSRLKR